MEIKVDNQIINYMKIDDEDYISITDMIKSKDGRICKFIYPSNDEVANIFKLSFILIDVISSLWI